MIEALGGTTSDLVKLALDVSVLRHKVIANNIANANTIGFIPQRVSFEEYLSNVSSENVGQLKLEIESLRGRLNNGELLHFSGADSVKLDMEMAKMAENVIRYQALLTGMNKHSSTVKLAINEGRQ